MVLKPVVDEIDDFLLVRVQNIDVVIQVQEFRCDLVIKIVVVSNALYALS